LKFLLNLSRVRVSRPTAARSTLTSRRARADRGAGAGACNRTSPSGERIAISELQL